MLYNVFNTQGDAATAQAYDFGEYETINACEHVESCTCVAYWVITTTWGIPYARATDGKWVYPVCSDSDGSYTTEEYSASWVA